jgi:type II secretory pathway pseudopilin PulG
MLRRIFLAVASVVLAVLVSGCADPPQGTERAALEAQGKAIIDQVEAYKAEHGRYPGDLAAAGITVPAAGYGGWRYESSGGQFTLHIGDYSQHLWELSWSSANPGWSLST